MLLQLLKLNIFSPQVSCPSNLWAATLNIYFYCIHDHSWSLQWTCSISALSTLRSHHCQYHWSPQHSPLLGPGHCSPSYSRWWPSYHPALSSLGAQLWSAMLDETLQYDTVSHSTKVHIGAMSMFNLTLATSFECIQNILRIKVFSLCILRCVKAHEEFYSCLAT